MLKLGKYPRYMLKPDTYPRGMLNLDKYPRCIFKSDTYPRCTFQQDIKINNALNAYVPVNFYRAKKEVETTCGKMPRL